MKNTVAVVFFIDLLLFEFLAGFVIGGSDMSCDDLACFLEVILGVGLDLGVAGAAIIAVALAVIERTSSAFGGGGNLLLLERLHLAITAVVLRVANVIIVDRRPHHDGGQRACPTLVSLLIVMDVRTALQAYRSIT